ncbi:hypothetical protein DRH27_00090 [Candidatus Falkowbacteria bacterium]|nr:MAG: hypothetical protein DRH27_00090 [Candidatus Falkowbacteria bacterium]
MSTRKRLKDPEEIKKHVGKASLFLQGEFNLTRAGVPRIIVKTKTCTYSIVYLARADKWKLFYPFPGEPLSQKKKYFESLQYVKTFLEDNRDS